MCTLCVWRKEQAKNSSVFISLVIGYSGQDDSAAVFVPEILSKLTPAAATIPATSATVSETLLQALNSNIITSTSNTVQKALKWNSNEHAVYRGMKGRWKKSIAVAVTNGWRNNKIIVSVSITTSVALIPVFGVWMRLCVTTHRCSSRTTPADISISWQPQSPPMWRRYEAQPRIFLFTHTPSVAAVTASGLNGNRLS